ncbi:MAG: hypothetical protein E7590_07530 [Ruminococcaceae bacterium]|nr:hypothetical protein [Oscillospiraceae bacterium]
MAIKLKPCPFCKGAAVMHTHSQKEEYKACCKDLTCIGSYIFYVASDKREGRRGLEQEGRGWI